MTVHPRIVLDASVMISAINSADPKHEDCYQFVREREATWVVPLVAAFEFHAAQSRAVREGRRVIREIYWPNAERYEITTGMLRRVSEAGLFERLSPLRGADLIYACVAALEHIPLATHDRDFEKVADVITVLWV